MTKLALALIQYRDMFHSLSYASTMEMMLSIISLQMHEQKCKGNFNNDLNNLSAQQMLWYLDVIVISIKSTGDWWIFLMKASDTENLPMS